MPAQPIKYNSKELTVHKAIRRPDFNSATVLTDDPWEYVNLWMDRANHANACFFWNQARGFYDATKNLPPTAAPLTAYYAILNATKALLYSKSQAFNSSYHGVTGQRNPGKTALTNEVVTFCGGGVHAGLRQYLREPVPNRAFCLKELFYNMPFIHRAYTLTYSTEPELFIPIRKLRFVRIPNTSRSWFSAEIQGKQYHNNHVINKLPGAYERDNGFPEHWIIRKRQRFQWRTGVANKQGNLDRLTRYHAIVRNHVCYIHGNSRLWYIKRSPVAWGYLEFQNMTMIYAAMHRLSELARYSPDQLNKHFECQHNWLLTEFIRMALDQFIDDIASEITGHDFMPVGLRAQ